MRSKFIALVCAVLLLLTGCAPEPKDDFENCEWVEPPAVEGVTAQTEFTEYDGSTEKIGVIITNDSGEKFDYDYRFFLLLKRVDDEWKLIHEEGTINSISYNTYVSPHDSQKVYIDIKIFVKLPLLPGHYQIWVGDFFDAGLSVENWKVVPAEFDVK